LNTTATITTPSDLLRISDLTATQLNALLDLADEMEDGPTWWTAARTSGAVGFLFDKPCERTRVSFELAAGRLGMGATMLRADERNLSGCTAIVVSTSAQATVEEIARATPVPVVNALTDHHTPCQALADLLTLRRWFGYLDGLRVAYVGDGDNVAHSLMEAGALAGMHVAVATPPGHEPDHEVTMGALALAAQHGGSIQLGHDPGAAVADSDVVYTGASATVDDALMRRRAPEAVSMHSLPAQRELEAIAQATLHMLIGSRPAVSS
jgi:ornithine carbamoyltransferase